MFFVVGAAPPDQTLIAEFKAFESLYVELQRIYPGPIPEFVSVPYSAVKAKMI